MEIGIGEVISSSLRYLGSWEEYQVRERGRETENLGKKIKIKKRRYGEISSCRELSTSLTNFLMHFSVFNGPFNIKSVGKIIKFWKLRKEREGIKVLAWKQ